MISGFEGARMEHEDQAVPDTLHYTQPPPPPFSALLMEDAFSDDLLGELPQPGTCLNPASHDLVLLFRYPGQWRGIQGILRPSL